MQTNGNGYAPGSGTIMGAMSEFNPQAKAPVDPKREAVNQELTGNSGFLVPHHRTFLSVLNAFSRIYSYRYDEAIRRSRSDALALKRDVYIRALMQERIYPLGRWKWEIESDPDDVHEALAKNPKDPQSVERETVRRHLQAVATRTPRLKRMIRSLGWADWYGKQGCQLSFGQDQIAGELRKVVKDYRPVEGDKILYSFDGVPGIVLQMGAQDEPRLKYATIRYTDLGMPVVLLDRPEFREMVIIHTYDLDDADITEALMGGRIHGVGIRDAVAWACELRLEMMSWIMDFMEKVGNLGILIFYYEEGNPAAKTAAENSAKNASGRNALAVPVPRGGDKKTAGVDILPANMAGVQFLLSCVTDWFERHIERMIVGQSMSGGKDSGDGLGGTGRADFAKDTKYVLLASDAEDMGETLTTDFIKPLKEANFAEAPWRYTWQFRVPDPNADKILDAVGKAANMPGKKLTFKADEVRQLVGLTKPDDGDDIVGGEEIIPVDPNRPQPMPGQPPTAGGQPGEPGAAPAGTQPSPAGGAGDGGKEAPPADVPGMGELVAAMFQAAEAEDWDAVDRLAELGADPSALAGLMDDDEPASDVVAYQRSHILPYQWSQGTTRSGHIKAVWSGDGGARKPLYGQAAERALANQGKRDRGEEVVNPAVKAKEEAAKREPGRQEARETWKGAAENPGGVRPEQLPELADQLKRLTRDEIRNINRELGNKLGGLKADLVQRLLDHVGAKGEEPATEAKKTEKAKPKRSTKASTGESLAAVVQSYGGIDPNDSELKAHFSGMKEALEYGFTIGMFKKGGAGLDQMANTLEAAGHITTPEGKFNTQHLVDQLAKKARSDLFDTTKEVESALDSYYRELSEATGGTNDYTPGELGDDWDNPTTDRPEVAEAVRGGKEAGEREAQTELSNEGGGSTAFDFGHNAEPVTADAKPLPEKLDSPDAMEAVFDKVKGERFADKGRVPIHELRAEVRKQYGSEAASPAKFDELMHDLRRAGKLRLIVWDGHKEASWKGERETEQQLKDSIDTPSGKVFHAEWVGSGHDENGRPIPKPSHGASKPTDEPVSEPGSGYTYSEPKPIGGGGNKIAAHGPDGEEIGHVEYHIDDGKISIGDVKVHSSHRRKGVATELYNRILKAHPGAEIKSALQTEDGKAFRESFDKRNKAGTWSEPDPVPNKAGRKAVVKDLRRQWSEARQSLGGKVELPPEKRETEKKLLEALEVLTTGKEREGPHDLGPVSPSRYDGYKKLAAKLLGELIPDNPKSPLDSIPAGRHNTGVGGQSADPKPEGGTMTSELPKLSGSEKQVGWADQIRTAFTTGEGVHPTHAAANAVFMKNPKTVAVLSRVADAKAIIDNRDNMGSYLIRSAYPHLTPKQAEKVASAVQTFAIGGSTGLKASSLTGMTPDQAEEVSADFGIPLKGTLYYGDGQEKSYRIEGGAA